MVVMVSTMITTMAATVVSTLVSMFPMISAASASPTSAENTPGDGEQSDEAN